jgi:hypothetical protein
MKSVVNQMLVEFINEHNEAGDAERSMEVMMWQGASMTTWKLKQIRENFARKSHNNNPGITQRH